MNVMNSEASANHALQSGENITTQEQQHFVIDNGNDSDDIDYKENVQSVNSHSNSHDKNHPEEHGLSLNMDTVDESSHRVNRQQQESDVNAEHEQVLVVGGDLEEGRVIEALADDDNDNTKQREAMSVPATKAPFYLRVIPKPWYPKMEKASVDLYIILLLFSLFIEPFFKEGLAREIATGFMYWGLVIAPHALFFGPLLISLAWCNHRLFVTRFMQFQVLLLVGLLSTIPMMILWRDKESNERRNYICRSAAVLVCVVFHFFSCFGAADLQEGVRIFSTTEPLVPVKKTLDIMRASARTSSSMLQVEQLEKALFRRARFLNLSHARRVLQPSEAKRVDNVEDPVVDGTDTSQGAQGATEGGKEVVGMSPVEAFKELLAHSFAMGDRPMTAIWILLGYYRRFWFLSIRSIVGGVGLTVLYSLIPFFIGNVVLAVANYTTTTSEDEVSSGVSARDDAREIMMHGVILVANFFLLALFGAIGLDGSFLLGSHIDTYLKAELLQTVTVASTKQSGPATNAGGQVQLSAGDLSSRFSNDIAAVSGFISETMYYEVLPGIISFWVSLVLLGMFEIRMAVFLAVCIPILVLSQSKFAEQQQQGDAGVNDDGDDEGDAHGRLQGRFQNLVQLRRTTELYGSGDYVWSKTRASVQEDFRLLHRSAAQRAHFVAKIDFWGYFYVALLTLAFILDVIQKVEQGDGQQQDAVRQVTVALQLIVNLFYPMSDLSRAGQSWLQLTPALHRLNEVTTRPREARKGREAPKEPPPETNVSANEEVFVRRDDNDGCDEDGKAPLLAKKLDLSNVHFTYPGAPTETLKGLDATFQKGQYTCIVGASGSGKSTLLGILTRELMETSGSVSIDGYPVTLHDTRCVRDQMGIVLQDAHFFDASIEDNIRMGNPQATESQVRLALERAQATEFVNRLPNGLATLLGASDLHLSGGQVQRLSLARALVRSPRVLVLDEATSALDPVTEESVIHTVCDLARNDGMVVISVTHRLNTTDSSDNILVLRGGLIAEQGSPNKLNQENTLFAKLRKGEQL